MKTITIDTNLLGRTETFKILAVGHATQFPVLLVGPAGVGKTKCLLDYSLAMAAGVPKDALDQTFILETDEGTRAAEIKGRVNMKKLLDPVSPEYTVLTPAAEAKMVLINEVDKANSGFRNSMLGIMNERVLFNGEKKILCNWELFCASCNIIPKEEEGSPFWDRFVIKHRVNRLTKSQMVQYYTITSKAPVKINVPEEAEILDFISNYLPKELLRKFVELTYDSLSDRTLSYVPKLVAAVAYCFDVPVKKAMIKTAELLTNPEIAKKLATQIEVKEISDIRQKIDMIKTLAQYDQIVAQIDDVKRSAKAASANPDVSKNELQELANELNRALAENPVYSKANDNIANALNTPTESVGWNKPTAKY